MRVLVCGGRDYRDWRAVSDALRLIHDAKSIDLLIHGAATGADTIAHNWALLADVRVRCFDADWETYGRAAGPMRNKRMLDEGRPELVVAFPGGKGTADMIRQAEAAGVRIWRPTEKPASE